MDGGDGRLYGDCVPGGLDSGPIVLRLLAALQPIKILAALRLGVGLSEHEPQSVIGDSAAIRCPIQRPFRA